MGYVKEKKLFVETIIFHTYNKFLKWRPCTEMYKQQRRRKFRRTFRNA